MAVFGAVLIAIVWFRGDQGWQGLLTALVGMAAGGGLLWLVRVFCFVALGREAMGFVVVSLMAMIGAFLGWQATLIIFFLAPLAGLVVGVLRVILFRDREIPYGPFLCLASLFLIVQWDAVWERTEPLFAFGWVVPVLMLACPPAMAIMLGFWRLILAVVRR
jgi:prepilin signal peptidase PulO-like enzyme (type II secretory pathway)